MRADGQRGERGSGHTERDREGEGVKKDTDVRERENTEHGIRSYFQ